VAAPTIASPRAAVKKFFIICLSVTDCFAMSANIKAKALHMVTRLIIQPIPAT